MIAVPVHIAAPSGTAPAASGGIAAVTADSPFAALLQALTGGSTEAVHSVDTVPVTDGAAMPVEVIVTETALTALHADESTPQAVPEEAAETVPAILRITDKDGEVMEIPVLLVIQPAVNGNAVVTVPGDEPTVLNIDTVQQAADSPSAADTPGFAVSPAADSGSEGNTTPAAGSDMPAEYALEGGLRLAALHTPPHAPDDIPGHIRRNAISEHGPVFLTPETGGLAPEQPAQRPAAQAATPVISFDSVASSDSSIPVDTPIAGADAADIPVAQPRPDRPAARQVVLYIRDTTAPSDLSQSRRTGAVEQEVTPHDSRVPQGNRRVTIILPEAPATGGDSEAALMRRIADLVSGEDNAAEVTIELSGNKGLTRLVEASDGRQIMTAVSGMPEASDDGETYVTGRIIAADTGEIPRLPTGEVETAQDVPSQNTDISNEIPPVRVRLITPQAAEIVSAVPETTPEIPQISPSETAPAQPVVQVFARRISRVPETMQPDAMDTHSVVADAAEVIARSEGDSGNTVLSETIEPAVAASTDIPEAAATPELSTKPAVQSQATQLHAGEIAPGNREEPVKETGRTIRAGQAIPRRAAVLQTGAPHRTVRVMPVHQMQTSETAPARPVQQEFPLNIHFHTAETAGADHPTQPHTITAGETVDAPAPELASALAPASAPKPEIALPEPGNAPSAGRSVPEAEYTPPVSQTIAAAVEAEPDTPAPSKPVSSKPVATQTKPVVTQTEPVATQTDAVAAHSETVTVSSDANANTPAPVTFDAPGIAPEQVPGVHETVESVQHSAPVKTGTPEHAPEHVSIQAAIPEATPEPATVAAVSGIPDPAPVPADAPETPVPAAAVQVLPEEPGPAAGHRHTGRVEETSKAGPAISGHVSATAAEPERQSGLHRPADPRIHFADQRHSHVHISHPDTSANHNNSDGGEYQTSRQPMEVAGQSAEPPAAAGQEFGSLMPAAASDAKKMVATPEARDTAAGPDGIDAVAGSPGGASAEPVHGIAKPAAKSGASAVPGEAAERQEQVLATIVRYARIMVQQGKSAATIRLEPPSLGRVRLEISTDHTRVSGRIVVEKAEVRDLVQQHLPELRESLAQNGMKVESFDVQVGHNGGSDNWARRRMMESMQRPAAGELSPNGTRILSGDAVMPHDRTNRMILNGTVDLWI